MGAGGLGALADVGLRGFKNLLHELGTAGNSFIHGVRSTSLA